MKTMKIGNREIGPGNPCYIIAEAGSNHDGDIEQAKKLIDIASQAGADAVKFQMFVAAKQYSKFIDKSKNYDGMDIYNQVKNVETPREWLGELANYCKQKNITFFATPFDNEAVDALDPYVDVYKTSSVEIVDLGLMKCIAEKQKPMIVSTGMASMGDIEDLLKAVHSMGNDQIALLHCNTIYPTPPHAVNLRAMETMGKAFHTPIGYSDHTLGIHISLAAVAMGASIIEKHFTLDRSLAGPDHSYAIEPDELASLVSGIRDIESSMGTSIKKRSELEHDDFFNLVRRSIIAKCNIPAGTKITKDMLIVKRPGYGIAPKHIDTVIGRTATQDIEEEQWITWEMI